MKYKRRIAGSLLTLTLLAGGSAYAETGNVRVSKIGLLDNQLKMKSTHDGELSMTKDTTQRQKKYKNKRRHQWIG